MLYSKNEDNQIKLKATLLFFYHTSFQENPHSKQTVSTWINLLI